MTTPVERVSVNVALTQEVWRPVAEKIASDFAEWLDQQGFRIELNPEKAGRRSDDRSYAELARDFCDEWG